MYDRLRQIIIRFSSPVVVRYVRKFLFLLGNIYWFLLIKAKKIIQDIKNNIYQISRAIHVRWRKWRKWQEEKIFKVLIIIYKAIIFVLPSKTWTYCQLLNLWERKPLLLYEYKGSLGNEFLRYFDRLWKIDSIYIFDYRRSIYIICTVSYRICEMENYAQKYIDTQEKFIKSHNLDKLCIRFSHSPIFNSYNLHVYLDTHIKAILLGWQSHHKIVFLLPHNQYIANPCMFEYWQQYIEVKFIDKENSIESIAPEKKYLEDDFEWVANLKGRASYIEYAKCIVQKQWEQENRPPLWQLTREDREFGWTQLAKFNIPKNSWFVSLHVRDAGYTAGSYLAKDEYNAYRNADIDSYREAIEAIVQQGGYVIRVGDPKMKPLPEMEGVLDYALSNIYSNRMDIFLFSQCRFFVGVASGPVLNPTLFGVPVVMTNYLPVIARPHANNCIFMPKLLWLNDENRYATFSEVLASELGRMYTSHGYTARNIGIVDNQPDDIKNAVLEMIDWLEDKMEYTEQDEQLQNRFNDIYRQYSGYGDQGRASKAFLKKYRSLL
jgi:putative glycosyltransferase (TIGR04372 family)